MFITVEDLQKYTGVHSDDTDLQKVYLQSAGTIVEDYLGYKLHKRNYISYFDGNGTNTIQLRAMPVRKIYKITINDAEYDDSVMVNGSFIILANRIFPVGTNNVVIIYEAGYEALATDTETDDTGPEIDDDVDLLKINVIADAFVDEDGLPPALNPDMPLPLLIKMTILRIASILQAESDSNIAVTSKTFGDSGSRVFMNYTNFDKYLLPISSFRLMRI